MSAIKLHEATKDFKIPNKFAMFFLEQNGMPVKSPSSTVNSDQLELLREFHENPDKFAAQVTAFDQAESDRKAAAKERDAAKKRGEPLPPEPEPEPQPAPEPPPPPPVEKKVEKKPVVEPVAPAERAAEPPPQTPQPQPVPEPVRSAPVKHTPAPAKPVPSAPAHAATPLHPTPPPARPVPPPARPVPPPASPVRPSIPSHPSAPRRPAYTDHRQTPGSGRRGQNSRGGRIETHRPRSKGRQIPVKPEIPLDLPKAIEIADYVTLHEIAEKLNIKLRILEDKVAELKLRVTAGQCLAAEDVQKICDSYGVALAVVPYEDAVFAQAVAASKAGLVKRAPVVTVMGHVDHGKTTLLDTLRKTRVAEKEAGGITQKIGAYTIRLKDHTFVFIDTPGHEAFTNLRARGAQVTDIVVLVVAANDGVQPQTIEAINHAKAAGVPIIVAINKIDLAGADSNRVKQELSKHQVLVEEWGGDVVAVEISAKLNKNLDQLLEMIHLVAELQELKAYPDVPARGTVIESRLDPQLGPIATVLIQHGHLSRGDIFMCGNTTGKIKSIFGDAGEVLLGGTVPQPVEVMGFEDVPEAGDRLQIVTDVERAKRVIDSRRQCLRDSRSHDQQQEKKISLQNLYQLMEGNKTQSFKVLLKADNFGSSEVLTALLQKKSSDRLKIEIIQSGIGNITEGDVLIASTAGAVIFAFNVKAPQKILALAKREQIEIKLYSVIYHLIEEVDQAIAGKIEPVFGETRIGMVEVLQVFKISKLGNVAGCLVREGKVTNKSLIKVMRGSDLVFEGIIQQLKRVKDEVAEVRAGTECGIRIKNFNDVEAGDTLEIYERTQIG